MKASVFWQTTLQAAALFASTGLSIWAVVIARTRRGVPGSNAFGWMMLAIALWSLTSAMHTLVPGTPERILIAKIQYLGIAPIGVLWLLFASQYSRAAWPMDRLLRLAVWLVPLITLVLAATNERHYVYWSAITAVATPAGTRLVYTGGPWYWVHAAYSYLLMAIGTLMLVRGLRRFPPPYRRQTVLMIVGALVPWVSNVLYLARITPITGLDLTPIGFTVSGRASPGVSIAIACSASCQSRATWWSTAWTTGCWCSMPSAASSTSTRRPSVTPAAMPQHRPAGR